MVEIPTQRQEYGKPVTISSHFKKRFKERTPLKNPERFLSLCIKRGWSLNTLEPGTFPYQYLADKAGKSYQAYYYQDYIVILSGDNVAITILKATKQLSKWFKEKHLKPRRYKNGK